MGIQNGSTKLLMEILIKATLSNTWLLIHLLIW